MPSKSAPITSKRPTLKTIADELGVTTMTVSKSLRGIGRISEVMKRQVRAKAEEIGYLSSRERLFPPFVRIRGNSDHQLRVLCPTVGDINRGEIVSYRNDMVEGLRRTMSKIEGTAVVQSFRSLDEMLELLINDRFHGVILSEPYPVRWIAAMRKLTSVVYTVGHDFLAGVDSVFFNESRAAAAVATQLRKLGHRHIGWLGIHDRHAQFLVPDEEFGREESADWLSHTSHGTRYAAWLYLSHQRPDLSNWQVSLIDRDWRVSSLAEAVGRGCRAILDSNPQPTAVVCVSNTVACELIRQLEENGFRVPEDISVVSYGVEEGAIYENGRKLTGLSMPMDKVGGLVPEVLQRRLAYPDGLPISIQLDAEWRSGNTLCSRT